MCLNLTNIFHHYYYRFVQGKGCFGDGPGQIANETALLTYWTTNLTHYHRFIFTLVISKDGKEPVAVTKIINVERGSFLPLAIRYEKYCTVILSSSLDMLHVYNQCLTGKGRTIVLTGVSGDFQ